MKFNILDCTLRDGGYYNNWDFDDAVVTAYLKAMAEANIDYVELGLRNFPKAAFLGAFAYTTEEHINSLDLPIGPIYGVMVDAKTILESGLNVEDAINALFVPANKSKVNLVRVAAHFHEVESSGLIVKHLKKLGYIVGYNLMQAGGKSADVISDKARQAAEWDAVDALYFADSLGNMDCDEVNRIVAALRVHWSGPLGIHTHNNMGKGLDNTLAAKDAGVTWLDTTITGMGRGAGNTQTESLLAILDKHDSIYNSKPVYELVIRYFESMQKDFGWGSNLLYFLGAQNDVHPTYIQNLLSNTHYGTDEIVGAIDYLSKLEGTTSYNGVVLDTALTFTDNNSEVSGSTNSKSLFDRKDVLILTNGPSTTKYAKSIELYIKAVKPVVVSVNIVDVIPSEYIDYYIVSHNSKFLSDAKSYNKLDKPIILPKHRFSKNELNAMNDNEIIDYGIEIKSNYFIVEDTYSVLPFDITIGYVLAVLLNSKAKSISTVGFDGYEKNDPRQTEMLTIIELFNKNTQALEITSLTPSSYPVKKGSIYAPII
ncbi:Pyruvate carboxyltransferase [Moritella viscosa]|uniref:aldolase catalytic domain-containing protein n=1 Tax=Moritella viscosa TaxID=80854 RepID=UPI00091C729E|nr:aldolase catalytic domain-containing protein [Moritella viscosa]SGY94560.1 Pyruvate carboxyltransferase [Moritella viscosa]